MKQIRIEKVTLNIGAGANQERLKKGIKLITQLTGTEPVKTLGKKRIPGWGVRPGLPIGCKITFRRKKGEELVARLLQSKENTLKKSCFDEHGNVAFGVPEYIDIPNLAYDPDIGIIGLQVCITLERPGYRIKRRKLKSRKIPKDHTITQQDAIIFFEKEFKVKIEENDNKRPS